MGRPKLLLPWQDSTVIAHLLATYTRLGIQQIVVVMAASDKDLQKELERLQFDSKHWVINPQPEEGMFSSIQCAARWRGWNACLTHWIISLGDQPHLLKSTIAELIKFSADHSDKICQPEWQGRPKHPVVLPRTFFKELASHHGPHLKIYLEDRSTQRQVCPSNDPGLDLDIDYPADYQEALRLIENERRDDME